MTARRTPDRHRQELPLEDALISSLSEVRDVLRDGERLEERFTMRTVRLDLEPRDYAAVDVRRVRHGLGASQSVFAEIVGVRPKTIQAWEQGVAPSRMARRLLDLIDADHDRWRRILRAASRDSGAA